MASLLSISQAPQPSLKEMHQAASLLQKGQFPAAIEAYQRVLKLRPNEEAATLGLAAAYRGVYNYDETRRLLRQAAAKHPKSAAALVELGKLDIHLMHYDDALEELKRAVKRDPSSAAAHEQMGVAYQAKGDAEKALPELNEALRLNPHSASTLYFRGALYAECDDYDRAYQDANRAYSLEPNTQTGILLAKAATHSGKCAQAVDLLKPIAESASAEPEVLYLLAKAYKCAGQPDLAQQVQAEFESRSTKTQEARTQKMDADHLAAQAGELLRKNQLSPALELLNQALTKDPGNGPTYAVLAKIDFSRGDIPKAREEISTAMRNDPYNPDYLYVLGKVLEKEADLNGALQAFQKATLVAPKESDAFFEIGQIYLRLGQRTQAVRAFRIAVELSPEETEYRTALAKLTGQ